MSDDAKPPFPLRGVGDTLGDLARRVGDFVSGVSDSVTLPELVKNALDEAETLSGQGAHAQADELLRAAMLERAGDAHLLHALAAIHAEAHVLGVPLEEISFPAEDPERAAASRALLGAVTALERDDVERALEQVRRARRAPPPSHRRTRRRFERMTHVIAARAYARLGRHRRAAHELLSARGRMDERAQPRLEAYVLTLGVHVLLAEDRVGEAEHWISELERLTLTDVDAEAAELQTLRARIYAARRDDARALELAALKTTLVHPTEAQVRIAVTSAPVELARAVALAHLRDAPERLERQRLWALSQLRGVLDGGEPLSSAVADDVIRALRDRAAALPRRARDASLDELAFAALALQRVETADLDALVDDAHVSEELVLARLQRAAPEDPLTSSWISAGAPARLRRHRDVGGVRGPDEVSPLRQGPSRARLLATHRALTLARWCEHHDRPDEASEHLLSALIEDPSCAEAAARLGALHGDAPLRDLEGALDRAAEVLSRIPSQVGGVQIPHLDARLRTVMAARERLVRPLTIAVMGEFSSGKSSLVNALFRARVAPTGVLPTTSTINLFRRGDVSRARVHFRDGTITVLDQPQIAPFLHELDEQSAPRIRYVEIERDGEVIKNASIVDTPGLNALDAFHEEVARGFIDEADAIVWVFSATRGGAASELGMLQELREGGRRVLGVLNKVDTLEAHERDELMSYLRGELGDVLADLVPLCATEAERWRIDGATAEGDDPFAPVEAALDAHFLAHARTLKRRLAARSLEDTMRAAGDDLRAASARLDLQENGEDADDLTGRLDRLLVTFASTAADHVTKKAERLTLEWLAGGFLERGRGGRMHETEAAFAADHLEQAMNDALRDALLELSRGDALELTTAELLAARFAPWADGHLTALRGAGVPLAALQAAQRAIGEGEAAAREAIIGHLDPIARAWHEQLLGMRPALAEIVSERRRREGATGRAQATRLRVAHLARLEHVSDFVTRQGLTSDRTDAPATSSETKAESPA